MKIAKKGTLKLKHRCSLKTSFITRNNYPKLIKLMNLSDNVRSAENRKTLLKINNLNNNRNYF